MILPVTNIQRFCMHDGPGVRTTVFLKGCPLRCKWCHNMETQSMRQQVLFYADKCIRCGACAACPRGAHHFRGGKHIYRRELCTGCGQCAAACPTGALELSFHEMELEDVLEQVSRDMAFYGEDGGLTVSGGEPMAHPRQTLALLRGAKESGITTAVETCGYFDARYIPELCGCTDTLLWDVKDTDEERHRANTGVSCRKILENLFAADEFESEIILRCIILKGINLEEEHLRRVHEIFRQLRHCTKVEFLPCHQFGEAKAAALGMAFDPLEKYVPSEDEMDAVRSFAVWEK